MPPLQEREPTSYTARTRGSKRRLLSCALSPLIVVPITGFAPFAQQSPISPDAVQRGVVHEGWENLVKALFFLDVDDACWIRMPVELSNKNTFLLTVVVDPLPPPNDLGPKAGLAGSCGLEALIYLPSL